MNEKMLKDFQSSLKSVFQLAEVNVAAAEKIVNQQTALTSDLVKANVAHVKALAECKDVKAAVEANQLWSRELGEKITAAGKANLSVAEDARVTAAGLVEVMMKDAQSQVEASVAELRNKVEASVEEAKVKVEESMKVVQDQVAKATKKAA